VNIPRGAEARACSPTHRHPWLSRLRSGHGRTGRQEQLGLWKSHWFGPMVRTGHVPTQDGQRRVSEVGGGPL
jgi:hypothetical protein